MLLQVNMKMYLMDLYPQHLIKAIMIGDIELMEN